ncbi:glycosyltransferase, partial [Pseudomonas putida]|uniref:glycosyltransferase n=1 Tax=Pseudomonas putida TaxID=303 RepID=UPI001F5201AA
MVGFTTAPEDYFSAADFLCLPSYREGFPVSILEAGACGIPAIGSDIYGVKDAIRDQQTGLLFPPHDIKALSRLLVRLYQSPSLC